MHKTLLSLALLLSLAGPVAAQTMTFAGAWSIHATEVRRPEATYLEMTLSPPSFTRGLPTTLTAYCDTTLDGCAPSHGGGVLQVETTTFRDGGSTVLIVRGGLGSAIDKARTATDLPPALELRADVRELLDSLLASDGTPQAEYLRALLKNLAVCAGTTLRLPWRTALDLETYLGAGAPTDEFRGAVELVQNSPACS